MPSVPAAIAAVSHSLALDEAAAVAILRPSLDRTARAEAMRVAHALVAGARQRAAERSALDLFLAEYGLSNPEGIALMCLAEALLRVPDDATADALIADKLRGTDWQQHRGRSGSLFVNASTWGLMLTGSLVRLPDSMTADPGSWVGTLVKRLGEPIVRQATRQAIRIMADEFVVGRNIEAALERSGNDAQLRLCSFDMLGEGARTAADAERYYAAYWHAIECLGAANASFTVAGAGDLYASSGISIKLSALHPRYCALQRERVHAQLIPRALELLRLAAARNVAVTIDAEEADRLEISLEVMQALAREQQTRGWPGLGMAIQAYGRRASAVIEWLNSLSLQTQRPMSVRLVKGAYWDSEIKRAQERGLAQYPVYTRKVSTDVAYLSCARQLLQAPANFYCQFATHNAHSIATVLALRGPRRRVEFQRLHGMGALLYSEAQKLDNFPPVRVYAPVGAHEDLLAYLVRRLLENGANTSFVNRFMDESAPIEAVVQDPHTELAALTVVPNPKIAVPARIFGDSRRNSMGTDFGNSAELQALQTAIAAAWRTQQRHSTPAYVDTTALDSAFAAADAAQPAWNAMGATARAACLERAAELVEQRRDQCMALLVHEAKKTLPDAVAEVRETVDFCRYYAAEARRTLAVPQQLPGPTGESNELFVEGRGVFACISPWNFPLAIFSGQVAAALVAGNTVIAKPAEATPRIALWMTELFHAAGVPAEVLCCVPMEGRSFGDVALAHKALAGVAFTGSTRTALTINRALAARDGAIVPFIAETGGINAMVVDSTALLEQVTDDVLASAFGSAGQRCSALRLLFLQEDIADRAIAIISGAMDELVIGDSSDPATDVGPVISTDAALALMQHVEKLRPVARGIKTCTLDQRHGHDSFVAPHLIELQHASHLGSEAFGPLLHVVRFAGNDSGQVLSDIRASGYGLTLGVQSRVESNWRMVFENSIAGNTYVNRSMIGAVVGVQPFGGSGLSGTGPKAGGPHYLQRFVRERTLTVNTTASGGNAALMNSQVGAAV
jgi:RHH-type proline utilization regulon transcriptional repressor/proline dehydrogenase/delta 1-pyrroline-5-carboxylate dehydrogenase